MSTINRYTDSDYLGEFNLLQAEKELIIKALIKSRGNIKKAKNFLCPEGKPFYGFVANLSEQIQRHGINLIEIKRISKPVKVLKIIPTEQEMKEINQARIQARLRALEQKEGIILKSVIR